jgi:hypothetical protein
MALSMWLTGSPHGLGLKERDQADLSSSLAPSQIPAANEAELESTAEDKPKRAPRSRKGFAAHLGRVRDIEIVIEPEIPADCEGLEKAQIGEDVSERLDVMRAKFRVIVTRRPK